jgi:hypothetical protein
MTVPRQTPTPTLPRLRGREPAEALPSLPCKRGREGPIAQRWEGGG